MAEPDKRQIGDGSDNYGEAAKQMAKAAKEAGKETAKQAAVKGAEAGANAAAATVYRQVWRAARRLPNSRRNRCGRTVGCDFIGGMGHASHAV